MNFILTLDYELFGDGSGDIFKHMIEPTNRLLFLCEHHNIKLTIFFEVVEYLRLKEEWENSNKMGYSENPILAIEEQIKNAAISGHDIQLHIHPQWVNAQYINNNWKVDYSNWRLGSFNKKGYTIDNLLKEGKSALESIISQVNPHYQCIALRAGGYNILPSEKVFRAMKKNNLLIDSSVFPEGYENGSLSFYDYRHVSDRLDYWRASPNNISKKTKYNQGITEIPIFAMVNPRWKKLLNKTRLKQYIFHKQKSTNTLLNNKISCMSIKQKLHFLREKEAFPWDYYLFNSSLHKKFLTYISNKLSTHRNTFVLIGHPKNNFNKKAFNYLINTIKKRGDNFKTIAQYYNEIKPYKPNS